MNKERVADLLPTADIYAQAHERVRKHICMHTQHTHTHTPAIIHIFTRVPQQSGLRGATKRPNFIKSIASTLTGVQALHDRQPSVISWPWCKKACLHMRTLTWTLDMYRLSRNAPPPPCLNPVLLATHPSNGQTPIQWPHLTRACPG